MGNVDLFAIASPSPVMGGEFLASESEFVSQHYIFCLYHHR
jgi:hypothetical protein